MEVVLNCFVLGLKSCPKQMKEGSILLLLSISFKCHNSQPCLSINMLIHYQPSKPYEVRAVEQSSDIWEIFWWTFLHEKRERVGDWVKNDLPEFAYSNSGDRGLPAGRSWLTFAPFSFMLEASSPFVPGFTVRILQLDYCLCLIIFVLKYPE